MSKLFLTGRIPSEYNRQTWFDILRQIEENFNAREAGYMFPSTAVSANYTVADNDTLLLVNASGGAVTVTLPTAAASAKRRLVIKKIDSSANAVTVDGNGSETIDDSTTAVISSQYDSIDLMSDGTEWWIV